LILFIIILSAIFSLLWHGIIKNIWIASLITTLCTTLIIWYMGSSHIGSDIEFVKNISIIGLIAFTVSLGIGFVFLKVRQRNLTNHSNGTPENGAP
jgi:hypothetical protein